MDSFHQNQDPKDFLWLHLKDLPYFRALLRAVEARFYQDFVFPEPVLDVGCGDGHFASLTFNKPINAGIDPWWGPLTQAISRRGHQWIIQAQGARMPFPNKFFGSAFSNSVLEHIPLVGEVLEEVARVVRPGGRFVFCVPNNNFNVHLSVARFFDRLRISQLADGYRKFFTRISRHHHLDPPSVWSDRLRNCGFRIEDWWHYFSPRSLRILEWGHYLGLPSLFVFWLTKRWILVQHRANLWLPERITRAAYEEPRSKQGVYTFFVTRRV